MQELAFLGDALHTLFIRQWVVKNHSLKLNEDHRLASKFCNAKAQSTFLDKISPSLSDEEANIVRMARNSKAKHSAKNADPVDYHRATALEALLGWLYINENKERLQEILNLIIVEEEKC